MDDSVNRPKLGRTFTMPSNMNTSPPNGPWYERALSITDRRRRSLGQSSGAAAIHDAIAKGKVHLARFILDAVDGDIVNARDIHGKTPLIRACKIREEKARIRAVELLLARGAGVNLRDNMGRTALSYACELRCNDTVKILVKNNVDPDIEDNNGNTALMYCASVGNDKAIEIITKSFRRLGLDVDRENDEGLTPLIMSARNGFLECATLLAQEGKAAVDRRDSVRNLNAEEWARENGCSTPEVEPFAYTRRASSVIRTRLKKRNIQRPLLTSFSQSSDSDRSCHSSFEEDQVNSDKEERQNKTRAPTRKTNGEMSIEELTKKFSEMQKQRGIVVPNQLDMPPPSFRTYRHAKRCSLPNVTIFQDCRLEVIKDEDGLPVKIEESEIHEQDKDSFPTRLSPVMDDQPQRRSKSPKLSMTGKSSSMDDSLDLRGGSDTQPIHNSRRNSAASVNSRRSFCESPVLSKMKTDLNKPQKCVSRRHGPITSADRIPLQKSKSEYVTVTSLPSALSRRHQKNSSSRVDGIVTNSRDEALASVESASHIEFDFDSETRNYTFMTPSPKESDELETEVFLPPLSYTRDLQSEGRKFPEDRKYSDT